MDWYRWQEDTLFIQLHVQPRKRLNQFKGLLNNRLCIGIKALPVDGKANQYLLALIANEFNVSRAQTSLISGAHHKDKCVAINSPTKLPDWFLELTRKSQDDAGNF